MPPHIAAQQLQANVQHLDNTFFQVLALMIQEERKNSQYEPSTNMPGYIFESILEDRSRANQKMQYLQSIHDHALNLINQSGLRSPVTRPEASKPELMIVSCQKCGKNSYITCPGFGKHAPSVSVIKSSNGPQCMLCGTAFAYVTCNCGHVTYYNQPHDVNTEQATKKNTKPVNVDNKMEQMIKDFMNSGKMDQNMMNQLQSIVNNPEQVRAAIEQLKAAGADEMGSEEPLKIEDFYKEGSEKFDLNWPLNPYLDLPTPFPELDRKTQFYVLFNEWQTRETEGMMALNNGALDQAENIFQECITRAEQIEVPELKARSYEGLMRLAQKQSDRTSEKKWSEKAMETRKT